MVSHPDILENEVKWALGITAVNKASRCDGILAELLKTLKDDATKVLHSKVSKSGRPSSSHRTGKAQSSSQFPRRVVLKNLLIIGQLDSSSMLVTSRLKFCMLGFCIMLTKNFQKSKLGRKGRRTRDQTANICWIIEKAREFQKNIYLWFID